MNYELKFVLFVNLGFNIQICHLYTLFSSKNQIILTEAHCSYFFQLISASFVPILFLRQLSTSKKETTIAGWGIHIFGAKVLNFLELPEIIHFFHIYEFHIFESIFSFVNGASRILNLNLILMVLNLCCRKILCIYTYV